MPIGEQSVQPNIELGGRWRDVGDQPLHQWAPDASVREQRAGSHADGVEHMIRRQWVVDISRKFLAEQHADAQVERVDFALGQATQEFRGVDQRGLLVMIEGVEHAQRC